MNALREEQKERNSHPTSGNYQESQRQLIYQQNIPPQHYQSQNYQPQYYSMAPVMMQQNPAMGMMHYKQY